MILLRGLRLMPGEDRDKLKARAAKKLGVRTEEIAELAATIILASVRPAIS